MFLGHFRCFAGQVFEHPYEHPKMALGTPDDRRFVRETGQERAVADLAQPILDELGFQLVRVKVSVWLCQ